MSSTRRLKGFFIILGLLQVAMASGQTELIETVGVVSYISGEHFYVRFAATDLLQSGDTLYATGGSPCLLVKHTSSISCITTAIGTCSPAIGDSLIHRRLVKKTSNKEIDPARKEQEQPADVKQNKPPIQSGGMDWKGTVGVSSLTNRTFYSEKPRSSQRSLLRFNLRGKSASEQHPLDVTLSGNYQHYYKEGYSSSYPRTGRLSVYQAYADYGLNHNWSIRAGRFIQTGLSSAGIMDASRVQYRSGGFSVEALAGLRPELGSLRPDGKQALAGLNTRYQHSFDRTRLSTGLGWFQQYQQGKLDRRTLLSQGSLLRANLALFYMAEVDATSSSDPWRLQSVYVSANYRFSSKWRAFLSYDTRLPFVYWTTYDVDRIEELLDREAQRGLRARFSYRPRRDIYLGIESTYRFSQSTTNMRMLGASVRKNHLFSNYNSMYYRLAYADYGLWENLQQILRFDQQWGNYDMALFYRHLLYTRSVSNSGYVNQSYFGLQQSWNMKMRMNLSVSAEYDLQEQQKLARLYVSLRKYF